MKTIYKWEITVSSDHTILYIPASATVIHVGSQGGAHPVVWMELDINAPQVARKFCVVGTGYAIPLNHVYIGTSFIGPYVWHVYEEVCNEA